MNIPLFDKDIISLRFFGSYVRGDFDNDSDYDVLLITNDKDNLENKISRTSKFLLDRFNIETDISWYSKNKIEKLYIDGDLFAWHIFHESKKIIKKNEDYIDKLGKPNKYNDFIDDISSLIEIMESIKKINEDEINIIYELGILFVCLRNIGLIFSIYYNNNFDYSHYSPFNLGIRSIELDKNIYNVLRTCRRSSMRGTKSKTISYLTLKETLHISLNWANGLLQDIRGNIYGKT